ncbi:MAG: alpha-L-fucosidase [Clostridia bacterium]|nr:alpha-L-fucosidase [Clostridia bacterium]
MVSPTDNMRALKWGVFNHYICSPGRDDIYGTDLSDWNSTVNSFDADKLSYQLHKMGAGYYFITLIHGTEYMIAPNATYDGLMGVSAGELCARRDLVEDIYRALSKYGIQLGLYFNCLSPFNSSFGKKYRERVGVFADDIRSQKNVLLNIDGERFVRDWSAVLREFAVRYGDKIKAWWLDSCYDYSGYTPKLLKYYHDAIKEGNPEALIGFNQAELILHPEGGLKRTCEYEEMTCGECNTFDYLPTSGDVDGALTHLLIPLGKDRAFCGRWCSPEADYEKEFIQDYIEKVNAAGGIVTLDIFVAPDAGFSESQMALFISKKDMPH